MRITKRSPLTAPSNGSRAGPTAQTIAQLDRAVDLHHERRDLAGRGPRGPGRGDSFPPDWIRCSVLPLPGALPRLPPRAQSANHVPLAPAVNVEGLEAIIVQHKDPLRHDDAIHITRPDMPPQCHPRDTLTPGRLSQREITRNTHDGSPRSVATARATSRC